MTTIVRKLNKVKGASTLNILITGASGFIGTAIFNAFKNSKVDFNVEGISRSKADDNIQQHDLLGDTWHSLFQGIDVVVHCAGLAAARKTGLNADAELDKHNVLVTENIVNQAKLCGVKRVIFLSSAKVMGESTDANDPFHHRTELDSKSKYANSKQRAEFLIRQKLKGTNTDFVIIRPPLVYGAGVKGNFAVLMKLARLKLPLPFGAVRNLRSLVAIDNLVDLVVTCASHPSAANETFLVSDDEDVSTSELLKIIALSAGTRSKQFAIPSSLLSFGCQCIGMRAVADSLFANFQLDIEHTKRTLNWKPPVSVQQGIKRCIDDSVL